MRKRSASACFALNLEIGHMSYVSTVLSMACSMPSALVWGQFGHAFGLHLRGLESQALSPLPPPRPVWDFLHRLYTQQRNKYGHLTVTGVTLLGMADCNIRNFPDPVMLEVKVAAAKEGKTIKDWIVDVIVERLDQDLEDLPKPAEKVVTRQRAKEGKVRVRPEFPVEEEPVVEVAPQMSSWELAKRNPLKIEEGWWVSPDGERTCGCGMKRCRKCAGGKK